MAAAGADAPRTTRRRSRRSGRGAGRETRAFAARVDAGAAAVLRARDVPVPVGAHPHGARPQLHDRRRDRAPAPHARATSVLHPIGWDAFGLPAENAAIKHGVAPGALDRTTTSPHAPAAPAPRASRYDWERELATCDPRYYRWEQLFFLAHARARPRLQAARRSSTGAPRCETVLANEQVVDGRCWRCDATGRASASSSSGSSASRPTPTSCSPTSIGSTGWPEHVAHDAAQLDRPQRGRGDPLPARRARRARSPSSRPGPTRSSA